MASTIKRIANQMTSGGAWAEIEKLQDAVASEMPVAPGPQYTREFLASSGFVVEGGRFRTADAR